MKHCPDRRRTPPNDTTSMPQASARKRVVSAVFFLLLCLGLYTVTHSRQVVVVPNTEQADITLTPPLDSRLRDRLIAVVRQADDAEVEAYRRLDAAPLLPTYTGLALQRELSHLQALKNGGLSEDSHLMNQGFSRFRVASDGSKARVDVTEVWSGMTYSAANHRCVHRSPSRSSRQTISLTQTGSGWIVDDIQPNNS